MLQIWCNNRRNFRNRWDWIGIWILFVYWQIQRKILFYGFFIDMFLWSAYRLCKGLFREVVCENLKNNVISLVPECPRNEEHDWYLTYDNISGDNMQNGVITLVPSLINFFLIIIVLLCFWYHSVCPVFYINVLAVFIALYWVLINFNLLRLCFILDGTTFCFFCSLLIVSIFRFFVFLYFFCSTSNFYFPKFSLSLYLRIF